MFGVKRHPKCVYCQNEALVHSMVIFNFFFFRWSQAIFCLVGPRQNFGFLVVWVEYYNKTKTLELEFFWTNAKLFGGGGHLNMIETSLLFGRGNREISCFLVRSALDHFVAQMLCNQHKIDYNRHGNCHHSTNMIHCCNRRSEHLSFNYHIFFFYYAMSITENS